MIRRVARRTLAPARQAKPYLWRIAFATYVLIVLIWAVATALLIFD